eukprot:SAG31_NODE_1548_length_7914_cov_5.353423_6_plen_70_part_00
MHIGLQGLLRTNRVHTCVMQGAPIVKFCDARRYSFRLVVKFMQTTFSPEHVACTGIDARSKGVPTFAMI